MKKNRPTKDTASQPPARRISRQTLFLAAVLAGSCLVFAYLALFSGNTRNGNADGGTELTLEDIPINGERAYGYLKQICELGPRPSGSKGMEAQRKLLETHFRKLGGQVELQEFEVRHPVDRSLVPMANLIVHWHPKAQERVLLCAHYDTLPLPLRDPVNPRGRFVGANDGGSGVAVLMELAHEMPKLESRYGVDFVFFDGEEFMFREDGDFFLGSEYFARRYRDHRPPYRYRWGVLLDMVGDKDLRIYEESMSVSWPDTRPLVQQIWATAARLKVRDFVAEVKHTVRDDHLALRNTARIPTCDIIDFDYPPWHTQGDTAERCSPLSLAKVGWVVHEWLKTVR